MKSFNVLIGKLNIINLRSLIISSVRFHQIIFFKTDQLQFRSILNLVLDSVRSNISNLHEKNEIP